MPGKIHVSQETADQLKSFGKNSWLTMREDKVVAKGKGELTSYWVSLSSGGSNPSSTAGGSHTEQTSVSTSDDFYHQQHSVADFDLMNESCHNQDQMNVKTRRLVKWTVENMATFLKQIQVHRTKKRKMHDHSKVCLICSIIENRKERG